MDDDGVAFPVLDPEVRAYVYSLVTAVCEHAFRPTISLLTGNSWAGPGPTNMAATSWVTKDWHV